MRSTPSTLFLSVNCTSRVCSPLASVLPRFVEGFSRLPLDVGVCLQADCPLPDALFSRRQRGVRAGDRVVATGRNLEKVRKVFPDVASESIAFVQLDVAAEAQAKAAVDEATKRFGRIDVLVNNAGYSLLGNFEQMTTAEIQQQFATNFYGVVHLMQAALPVMRRQRSGHIINISSVAGVVGLKHCAAYAATKFAVEGLSLSVATEVEKFGIKITVVEPGFFRTDLLDAHNVRWVSKVSEDYAPEGTAEDMWSQYNGTQPNDPAKLGDALVKIAAMRKLGLESVVGKRIDSTYEPGERSGAWIKQRTNREQEFVIGGYIPGAHGFDALLVGLYQNKQLVFTAKVKNGFVPRIRDRILPALENVRTAHCPFKNLPEQRTSRWGESLTAEKMNECRWIKPKLVCQVKFVEWTDAGHLRHCTFVAMRDDKKTRGGRPPNLSIKLRMKPHFSR